MTTVENFGMTWETFWTHRIHIFTSFTCLRLDNCKILWYIT